MKFYSIIIAPQAKKQIEGLPPNIKSRIGDVLINVLPKDPFIGKALIAQLKGLVSYRVGDYRIIYSVVKNELVVQIIKVMHRREAYR